MPRLRLLAIAAGVSAAVLALVGPTGPGSGSDAGAQAARTVTVDPGPLIPGAPATVRWTGFRPGTAYVYVCQRRGGVPLPLPIDCYGDTLTTGSTGADGNGSAQITVRSALFPLGERDGSGTVVYPGVGTPIDCRGSVGCTVVVTECSSALDPTVAAAGPYELTPGTPGEYDDDPLAKIDWQLSDDDGDGVPETPFAIITPRPVDPPVIVPSDPLPPASRSMIRGVGSDLGGAVHNQWARAIADELDIPLDNTAGVDHFAGINGVLDGSADFAYSAAPATAAQLLPDTATPPEKLAATDTALRSLVYVPISVSTIAIGYNVYPGLPMRDVRISATSLAALLWPEGQAPTTISTGVLADDQGPCRPVGVSRELVTYSKAGNSEAHRAVSAWLDESRATRPSSPQPGDPSPPPPPWSLGILDRLPARGFAQTPIRHAAVPPELAKPGGGSQVNLSFAARFGLMDTTWAQGTGVQSAWLQNRGGNWVQPSIEGALATLATSPIGADNVVGIDSESTNPAAYPLVVVNYAVAPTVLSEDFTATDAQGVREALTFMISAAGQDIAAKEGFVPLTADLTSRAAATIATIGSVVPGSEQPTTPAAAPVPPAETPAATPIEPDPPEQPAAAAPTRPGGGGGSGGGSATPTTRPAGPTTTIARSGAPADTTTAATAIDDGGAAPTGTGQDAVRPEAATEPDELPPDVFGSLFDAVPIAPALPALGAAGATAAVAGQGINLWRVNRKRPPGLGP